MYTIIIHFGKRFEDWDLIEPFFYKAQSADTIAFFWEDEYSASLPFLVSLYDQIVEHLVRFRIQHYQLVLLLRSNDERSEQMRITSQIKEIRNYLLKPLKERGSYPQQIIMHLLDTIHRQANYSPVDQSLQTYWEVDTLGYVKNDQPIYGNCFTKSELEKLDLVWGEKLDIHQAGILDKPKFEFQQLIDTKKENVIKHFQKLLNTKLMKLKYHLNESDDWLTEEQLQVICEEFVTKINQLTTPPLSPLISSFLPSKELKAILKYYVGLQSEIGDIRLLRKQVQFGAHHQRLKGYLELAYFLLLVSIHPKIIDRLDMGGTYTIHIELNDQRLEERLIRYYQTLSSVNSEIKHRLFVDIRFQTNRIKTEEMAISVPISFERIDVKKIISDPLKINVSFFQQWTQGLSQIEKVLEARQRQLTKVTKVSTNNLAILKRNETMIIEEEKIDINDYLKELKQDIGTAQLEVAKSTPSLSHVVKEWRSIIEKKKIVMKFLLSCVPNKRLLRNVFSIILFVLLLPYFLSLPYHLITTFSDYLIYYFLVPVLIVTTVGFGIVTTKKYALKPIKALQTETDEDAKELIHNQNEAQYQYSHYLNQLYKLSTNKKYFDEISKIADQKKIDNLLLRYHQVRLEEYIQNVNRLLSNLQITNDTVNMGNESVPEVKIDKNILDNAVYSPFQQNGYMTSNKYGIRVYVGSSIEIYETKYLSDIEKIIIYEDKVYKI